jgi:3-oxoadipate enol-lactonase
VEVRHQIRVSDDVELEVATAGPLDAPPVVFVHGNGPNCRQFAPQFATFSDRYRLIAPSLRGHGRSQVPAEPTVRDFTIGRLAGDVLAVLDHLEVERAHVVGNSVGGLVGFELAATVPRRLSTLTTFGTTAQLHSGAALLWSVRATLRLLGTTGTGRLVARSVADREVGRTIAGLIAEADRRALGFVSRNIATYDYIPMLRESTVPWLLVRGSLDRGVNRTLGSTLQVIDARDDAAVIDLVGAGHFANLERPCAFDDALQRFIDRHVTEAGDRT